jgi:hypothetical protein
LARKLADLPGHAYGDAILRAATDENKLDVMFEAVGEAHWQRTVFVRHIRGLQLFEPYRPDRGLQARVRKVNLAQNGTRCGVRLVDIRKQSRLPPGGSVPRSGRPAKAGMGIRSQSHPG